MMTNATVWLFWFKDGPQSQYLVRAASMEDAQQEMSRRGISYLESGQVEGPGDDLPPGEWTVVNDQAEERRGD
jgi:hypothetical protein